MQTAGKLATLAESVTLLLRKVVREVVLCVVMVLARLLYAVKVQVNVLVIEA